MSAASEPVPRLSRPFWLYWASDALSETGTALSSLAVQLTLLLVLHAGAAGVGLVRAATTAPLLLFGIVAGAAADRVARLHILLLSAVGGALAMGALALLVAGSAASVAVVALLMFGVGVSATFQSAAAQAFVPDLAGATQLHAANRWLSIGAQVALIVGALASGFGLRWLPPAVLLGFDALSFAGAALACALIWRLRPALRCPPAASESAGGPRGVVAFLRWLYGYAPLRGYAVGLHLWFVGNGLGTTLFVTYAVQAAHASPVSTGLALAAGGVAGIVGAGTSHALQRPLGVRGATAFTWLVTGLAYVVLLLAPHTGAAGVAALVACQCLFGIGAGAKLPIELTYRNHATPLHMRGRMNAYIRTINWGIYSASAGLGGWAAARVGTAACLWVGAAAMLVAGVLLTRTRMGRAAIPDA